MILHETIELESAATTVSFTSIPQTGKDLLVQVSARDTTVGSGIQTMQLIGFYSAIIRAYGAAESVGRSTTIQGYIPDGSFSSEYFGCAFYQINDYTNTTNNKGGEFMTYSTVQTSGQSYIASGILSGNSTAAISTITFSATGSFEAGSTFSLFINE